MKIFERIKRKYTNGDPSSAEKTGIQKKRKLLSGMGLFLRKQKISFSDDRIT